MSYLCAPWAHNLLCVSNILRLSLQARRGQGWHTRSPIKLFLRLNLGNLGQKWNWRYSLFSILVRKFLKVETL